MNEYRSAWKKILLFVFSTTVILTLIQEVKAENKEKIVDIGNFTLQAPAADNWKVEIESQKGNVTFTKQPWSFFGGKLPLTTIHVVENSVLEEKWNLGEEEIANDIRRMEQIGMMVKGGLSGQYFLTDVSDNTIVIDGKKIYTMSYKNSGGTSFGKDKILEAVLHLYFPPEYRDKHKFYMIIIAEIHEINKKKETDFALVYPVINSLRAK